MITLQVWQVLLGLSFSSLCIFLISVRDLKGEEAIIFFLGLLYFLMPNLIMWLIYFIIY